jgi:hypothetical protein
MTYQNFKTITIQYLIKHKSFNVRSNSNFLTMLGEYEITDSQIRERREQMINERIIEKSKNKNKVDFTLASYFIKNKLPVLVKEYSTYTVLKINNKEVVVPNDDPILEIAILQNSDRR